MKLLYLLPIFIFAAGYQEPWGKDAELSHRESWLKSPPKRTDLASRIAEGIITFHQEIISPVDGPRSHFRPTSARYMLLAIRRHGFIRGYIMGCDRLLRENKDEWVYRTAVIDGTKYKWDPTFKLNPLRSHLTLESIL